MAGGEQDSHLGEGKAAALSNTEMAPAGGQGADRAVAASPDC